MKRTVMRVSVQASISATQMSANSIKYVTSDSWHYTASTLAINSRDSVMAFSVAVLLSARPAHDV
jgi:hypothetical protein